MPKNQNTASSKQIFNQKLKIWNLYSKMRVAQTLENTKEQTFRDIYNTYSYSFNLWGGVELVFWLQALVKKFKSYDSDIEPIYIYSLSKRNDNRDYKLNQLKAIAKQMNLDVTIKLN